MDCAGHTPTPSRISNCRYHLARVLALSGERQKILFKDHQKRQEEPQIPGNPLAGFYLTTIGRF
jgi:hypothetical protein